MYSRILCNAPGFHQKCDGEWKGFPDVEQMKATKIELCSFSSHLVVSEQCNHNISSIQQGHQDISNLQPVKRCKRKWTPDSGTTPLPLPPKQGWEECSSSNYRYPVRLYWLGNAIIIIIILQCRDEFNSYWTVLTTWLILHFCLKIWTSVYCPISFCDVHFTSQWDQQNLGRELSLTGGLQNEVGRTSAENAGAWWHWTF